MSRLNDKYQKAIKEWRVTEKEIPLQDEIDKLLALLINLREEVGFEETLRLSRKILPEYISCAAITDDYMMVYWSGDPRIKLLIDASLAELPEFLANEDVDIRKLAKARIEFLANEDVDIRKLAKARIEFLEHTKI